MTDTTKDLTMAHAIARAAAQLNGRVYFVGGYVRDMLLHQAGKDIDIEVHGLSPAQLEEVLDGLGERMTMGESFGVYGLRGYSLDIAMPRKETLRGLGHRDFDVCVEPNIGTCQAARRRDFTINAMMQDVLTGELVDHFGGGEDLKAGLIRHVDGATFGEDPLRVLRAAQFAARFGFAVAEETVELCRGMELSHLPKERVEGELKKALLKAEKPSVFFETLREMEQLRPWFSELADLIGLEQNPKHHAEGDVWVHTMMVLDEGAQYREKVADPFAFMLGCVTHDFGKVLCTGLVNGELHAYDHEIKGLPIAERFLRRLTGERSVIRYALNLTEFHMKPNTVAAAQSSIKVTNRMFDRAVDPMALICIAVSDSRGKIAPRPYVDYDDFLYERLAVFEEYMKRPYVTGGDLIDAGLTPGEDFSELLAFAHKLRLAGTEKENALKQTLAYARKLRK